ncbi:hypothetical protein D3C81_2340090 [compost metagenome]
MHCFVETQSFDIRVFQPAADKAVLLAWHLFRRINRFESDIFRIAGGFGKRQQFV